MKVALITGSLGLVGSSCVRLFAEQGLKVVGIDNDMRAYFFGKEASTQWLKEILENEVPGYQHNAIDIREQGKIGEIFKKYSSDIAVIIHCAAQPSHDWAASEPLTDFSVNATGTLQLLEATRSNCPNAVFIFCSTNKVYGDLPNYLPLKEEKTRYELDSHHPYYQHGIDESMSIDNCMHSLFGVSKVAADLMVQEYGRYFGIKSAVFRGGCLTGPTHSGAVLHGFLAYLMKCVVSGDKYRVIGYKGKQVRDNIHSDDLARCFYEFYLNPRIGEIYNIGGSRHSNCSVLEAIELCEEISGKKLGVTFEETNRKGDHQWWISDVRKFKEHYPAWDYRYSLKAILREIHDQMASRL